MILRRSLKVIKVINLKVEKRGASELVYVVDFKISVASLIRPSGRAVLLREASRKDGCQGGRGCPVGEREGEADHPLPLLLSPGSLLVRL